ncbi:hypothetical protein SAMN05421810_110122 [Amycolatopsis arida]|uniref:Polymerase/histidinol phosphatase N-terminal domain-containing protein n=1 Tax=Amycolatopsis arida TaxID=587909 RepID=A0A1I5ZU52_9PSEU|nr:CehA/McbA family metallohydrolase [Amycolatopsis arida]TDX89356.1 hypothetical protein CLV69_110123 [Amycolatopsis arida]SFQ59757.1 hypothetical protein SAMN05421810_110122 [Amycolatopsis arida]
MIRTVYCGRWGLDDRAAGPYRELPVDVPRGAATVTVRLRYDRGAGVLDLGCFDPGGFRGWSGGSRDTVTVAEGWATPGYLPGGLAAGTWRVCLGLHRIPVEGLDFEVVVDTRPVPAPPPAPVPTAAERPPGRALPAEPGHRWLAGDLHAHTVHSDGTLTVDQLAHRAAAAGLDFLAVTDHNTVSHHAELAGAGRRQGVLLLPGQEVTNDLGHANVFGAVGWVDFRRPAADWVAAAGAGGGLLSVNHPLAADCAWRHPVRPRFAEIWHETWRDRRWGGPLAWWLAAAPDAVPLGGSDFHDPRQGHTLGRPTTWAHCAGTDVPAVLAAIAAGRVAISAGPNAPVLLRLGEELHALDADGTFLVDGVGARRVVRGDRATVAAGPGPHRLEAPDGEVLALAA